MKLYSYLIVILMLMFSGCKERCKHKYGEPKDKYQFCVVCNAAKPMPCAHKWKVEDKYTRTYEGLPVGVGRISKCENCGEHKDFFVDILKK